MSTRWIAPGGNALARGVVTSSHDDTSLLVDRLFDLQPRSPARFTQSGDNELLLDSDLVAAQGSPILALEGETLSLIAGTDVTVQDLVTREYLQDDGTWAAGANTVTAPVTFIVRPYSALQRSTTRISVSPTSGTIIIPTIDALTIHGNVDLWQASDAIRWYSGTTSSPANLEAQAAPVAHSQLLTPSAAVTKQFHKLVFKGSLPYVGEAVLGRLKSIPEHTTTDGRQLGRLGAQERFSSPSGIVETFSWANRERIPYHGSILAPLTTSLVDLMRLFRAARSGADPFVLLPESDAVVLFGWISEAFGPEQVIGSALGRLDFTFDEAPHLTVIGEED